MHWSIRTMLVAVSPLLELIYSVLIPFRLKLNKMAMI